MISNTNIRTYRYPYAPAKRPQLALPGDWGRFFAMGSRQKAVLAAIGACALCVGITSAVTVHAKAMSVQADKQQVQSRYMALDNEHIHLLSARAQLSSRERITKIAGTRLQLFEPAENQVQRM